jgi:hypothetical protein
MHLEQLEHFLSYVPLQPNLCRRTHPKFHYEQKRNTDMTVPATSLANLKPRWQPGESGNVNGRPVGSRNQLSNAVMADLVADWAVGGAEAIASTRKLQPAVYVAIVARLLPADVTLTVEQSNGLTPDDLSILRAIKNSVPNANSRSPTEVLEYVRDTLRMAVAKPIENCK